MYKNPLRFLAKNKWCTNYFSRYTIPPLCSKLKRQTKHFIIVLVLSRLVGSQAEEIGDTTITLHPAICH